MKHEDWQRRGKIIRERRIDLGLSRKELARRIERDEDYIKKIEGGTRPGGRDTLERIAAALDISIAELFSDDESDPMKEITRREFLKLGAVGGLAGLTGTISGETQAVELALSANSPEALIVLGDASNFRGHWSEAEQYYRHALELLPKDYRWARYMVEKVTQMLINREEFKQAVIELTAVENIIEQWSTDEINRDLVSGLVAAKRGWIETRLGRYEAAEPHLQKSQTVGEKWGEIPLISTSHHFLGRGAIENQTRLLYPELFGSQKPIIAPLLLGLEHIREAQKLDKASEPNVAFGKQLEAMGLLILGHEADARKLLHESVHQLQGWTVEQTGSLVLLHRLEGLKVGHSWSRKQDLEELADALAELCDTLANEPTTASHPYPFVEAILSFLDTKYLIGDYKKSTAERKRCADLSVMGLLLHSHPEHPFFDISRALLLRFTQEMPDNEFVDYLHYLPNRIMSYSDDFCNLRQTSLLSLSSVDKVLGHLTALRFS
ncbi:MAG: helix-turn-helix domain-containing protein [Chloroflexi bacterium]|nr:helix-turn-helix domain-containing protein [Chloroflexota bacterium]